MTHTLFIKPLTAADFAPFGEVIELRDQPDKLINQGMCGRHHDLAQLDFGTETGGTPGISLFNAISRKLPYTLEMVERHPEGSQAFLPMHTHPFLVIVASDLGGAPDQLHAFVTNGAQGINFRKGTWHGVLTPLELPGTDTGLFAVVDRIGATPNLEEHWFETAWTVRAD